MKTRAAIIREINAPWSVEEIELDPPKAGEVLVKLSASGMCHSDEHVVTGDLALGAAPAQALESVRLLMLANDWTLRHLVPAELDKRLGLVQAKPATAFAPVAVTPDELGDAWQGGRAQLTVTVAWNGQSVGRLAAGDDMHFHFGQLLANLSLEVLLALQAAQLEFADLPF